MTIEQVDPVLARIAALEAKIQELEARDAQRSSSPEPDPERPVSRRRLIGMAGAAAAGAVGATALAATPAGANDPNDVTVDAVKTGSATTQLNSSANGVAAFFGNNTNTGGGSIGVLGGSTGAGIGTQGSTDTGIGVMGFASGAGIGVRALSFGGGNALRVEAPLGDAGSHMLVAPHSVVTGPPTTSAHELGQFWVDNAGALFQCTAAGSPGTWKRIGVIGASNDAAASTTTITSTESSFTLNVQNTGSGAGVQGAGGPGASSVGVIGNAGPGGAGVLGQSISGIGIRGKTISGTSLEGAAPTNGNDGAQLRLEPHASALGAPTTGAHVLGQFWVGSSGDLFLCTLGGTPGTWTKLNNQAGIGGSELVPLASPVRIYYSATAGDPLLGNGLERAVTVTNGTTIPHTASAVLTNLAVTPSGADGFLAMFKDGTTWPGTSNLNYSAGMFASNNATSAVAPTGVAGAGRVKIHCGGGAVHFVIDVFGYYT